MATIQVEGDDDVIFIELTPTAGVRGRKFLLYYPSRFAILVTSLISSKYCQEVLCQHHFEFTSSQQAE